MDAGFRRSGRFIYQPACAGCRECVPLRVPVEQFVPSKSQRRCARRNADLVVSIHKPQPSGEKYALYARYLDQWHGKNDSDYDEFVSFLYDSPVDTLEFEYRDRRGNRLLAVGICDICPTSLSSVYFYFDPAESRRSLGTFGALREIAFAREGRTPYYYLGYWIRGCGSMSYKADFRPHEILCTDGVWRAANSSPAEVDAS